MKGSQRSLWKIPSKIIGLLVVSLSCQIIWHHQLPPPQTKIQPLTPPPSFEQLRVMSLGDPIVSAKMLMLWLQAFDNQKGLFLSYKQLDYIALRQWLERILQIDPQSQYPLLAAAHLYFMVQDSDKQRQMLDFIYQQFFGDPHHRWRWLADAAILAKHRLKDLPLALKYAQAVTQHTTLDMPYWAKEMQLFILEDMGELEQARLFIGGLLATHQITDPKEVKFLNDKLRTLERKSTKPN